MKSVITSLLLLFTQFVFSQITFPVNGVANSYESTHAFINSTLIISPQQIIQNGTLIIKGDEIIRANADTTLPKGAIVHDMKGKYIYTSFIDINSNYGHLIESDKYHGQFYQALDELIRNPDSRRATMIYTRPSIWVEAFEHDKNDFICTNAVTYYIRNGSIHAVVQMRSNDVVYGYKNDYAWQLHV